MITGINPEELYSGKKLGSVGERRTNMNCNAIPAQGFLEVRMRVELLLKDRIVIGHALWDDLAVCFLPFLWSVNRH